eukprot:CAMPEP_0203755816 /NCGR_PEP_ID=MMETSP0098-20131031/9189_1 /ASSEMBLY_ACC=CAM_ASM_000208 /TAXON_ID=96639 /ORGANISM=" , Strain NY0313808BC1" /LENGTH=233 /DNA_ID=CAMNT_0050647419 /DNA_START=255 /DNA_END=954 /DNA_ORIENTATION=+
MQAQLNQVENTRNDGTQAAISSLVQQIVTQQTHQKQQHERQVMILENQRLLMQQQRINSGLGGLVYPAFNDVAIGNQNFSKTSNALKDHALSVKRQREAAAPMTNISQAKKIKSVSRSGGKRCHYDDCTKLDEAQHYSVPPTVGGAVANSKVAPRPLEVQHSFALPTAEAAAVARRGVRNLHRAPPTTVLLTVGDEDVLLKAVKSRPGDRPDSARHMVVESVANSPAAGSARW